MYLLSVFFLFNYALSQYDVSIQIFQADLNTITISMDSNEDVYGFQMNVVADPQFNMSLSSAISGAAQDHGLTVSTNYTGVIFGFSLTGSFIPAGSYTNLVTMDWTIEDVSGYFSLDIIGVAGSGGNPLSYYPVNYYLIGDVIVDCEGVPSGSAFEDDCGVCSGGTTGHEAKNDVDCFGVCFGAAFVNGCGCVGGTTGLDPTFCYGCTHPDAFNYDPDATVDDGSCVYQSVIDSLALVALYNSTNGDGWTNNTSWLTDIPFCNWYGITCESGNVTEVVQNNNNLMGSIPPELGNLINLTILVLSNNHLTGTVPSELGGLVNLNVLSLFNNQLTGIIPSELGNLENLITLTLASNLLTGTIPSEFGNMTNLNNLYLFSNQLTGLIPAELENLMNLSKMYLYSNQLTGIIPANLCNLSINWSNLNYFNIAYNQLCPPYPVCLADYVGVQDTSNCSVTTPAPTNLMATGSDGEITLAWDGVDTAVSRADVILWISNVTENNIEISIENIVDIYGFQFEILADDSLFSVFGTANGGVAEEAGFMVEANTDGLVLGFSLTGSYIPAGQGVLTDIAWNHSGNNGYLDLSIINFVGTGGIPLSTEVGAPYCYGCPTNIVYNVYRDGSLWAENIHETTYVDTGLGYSETHCYTVTAFNGIDESGHSNEACATTGSEYINPDSLVLVALYNSTNGDDWVNNTGWLTDTPFCDWYGITCENGNITQIDLGIAYINNNLTGEIPSELGNISSLEILDLSRNNLIGNIPVELMYLPNLVILDLGNNQLSGNILSEFENLINLRELNIEFNNFNGPIPIELGNLINLEKLIINGNSLVGTIPIALTSLSNLKELSLSGNQLSGNIPPELSNLENLTKLVLSNNQFTGIIPPEIGNLLNMKYLLLSGNNLSDSIPSEIGNLLDLRKLYLSSNSLNGNIPAELGNLTNLVYFDLSVNQLSGNIPPELGNLTDLLLLGLNNNQLSGNIPDELGNIEGLTYLVLSNNQLSGNIPESICNLAINWSHPGYFNISQNQLCPPYPECLEDYVGEQDTTGCNLTLAPPSNLSATGGDQQIILIWDALDSVGSRTDVTLWISNVTDTSIEISMENTAEVYGFQFYVLAEDSLFAEFGDPTGGTAEEAGFIVSANSNSGLVLGFSLSGGYVPPGQGVLTNLAWMHDGNYGYLDLSIINIAGYGGSVLSNTTGAPYCYECSTNIVYNVYRNGGLWAENISETTYVDTGLGNSETHCYTVTAYDGIDESGHSNEACATTNESPDMQHFTDLPENTGENHLVIIQDVIGLEPGDEIGLFDVNGILSSGDCSNLTGELLVGAGVWMGEQLGIVGTGSVDYCDIGGLQYAGYVEGHPIMFRVWNASDDTERPVSVTYSSGSGVWGEPVTIITMEVIFEVEQQVTLMPNANNLISFNVIPEDISVQSIFGTEVFLASDDMGGYYVPGYNFDTIEMVDITEGYRVFPEGTETNILLITGIPSFPDQSIMVYPNMNNMIPYLPQEPMSSFSAFGDYDDEILIVSNDTGEYYVPSVGIYSLTTLEPGKGYKIFLTSSTPMEFHYPPAGLIRTYEELISEIEAMKAESMPNHYSVQPTGISYPVILTSVTGDVQIGDELAAYAHGELVGAVKIVDLNQPIVIPAWQGTHEYGIDLPGFEIGDLIELRLWSNEKQKELSIQHELNEPYFGTGPLSSGVAHVLEKTVIPDRYTLLPAYPNPFNPITTLGYEIPEDSHVVLIIYDINGREITKLVDDRQSAGRYSLQWDASSYVSGIYFVRLITENYTAVQKLLLVK